MEMSFSSHRLNLTLKTKFKIALSSAFFYSLSHSAYATPIPSPFDIKLDQCVQETALQNGWTEMEQVTHISCSGYGIRDLSGIELFSALESLDVSQNPINFVDALFHPQAAKLQELNLSNTTSFVFDALPSVFFHQDQLMNLGLAGILNTPLGSLPPLPSSIKTLDVSQNSIRDLNFVIDLPLLTSLNISDNPIEFLEPLDTVSQLKELDISDTDIYMWAPHWQWPALESLQASNLPIDNWQDVGGSLSQMPQLQRLGLAGADIDEMWLSAIMNPQQILALDLSSTHHTIVNSLSLFPNLRELSLRNIGLQSTIELNTTFDMLETVDLSSNHIEEFDANHFLSSTSMGLNSINLANNNVTFFHIPPHHTTQLESLNLNNNVLLDPWQISSLLTQLENLEQLGIAQVFDDLSSLDNLMFKERITHLDISGIKTNGPLDLFWSFPELVELRAANSDVIDIIGLEMSSKLQRLDLQNNQLMFLSLPSNLHRLQELNVADNQLHTLDIQGFDISLTSLNLAGNTQLDPWQIQTLLQDQIHLNELDLSNISVEQHWLSQPHFELSLKHLKLVNTGLDDFNNPLIQLMQLRSLDISNNRFLKIDFALQLENLRALNAANNRIDFLANGNPNLRLRSLNLANNAFQDMNPLIQFLQNQWTLTSLNLDGAPIENQFMIPNLLQLRELSLQNTGLIGSFDAFQFPKLVSLNLSNNHLTDIFCLDILSNLENLNIAGNRIVFFGGLSPEAKIKTINVSHNTGFDLVSLFFNNPFDHLQNLSAAGLGLKDFGQLPLWQLDELRKLDLSSNKLTNIQGIETLFLLSELDLSYNCLDDAWPINQLSELNVLNLNSACLIQLDLLTPFPQSNRLQILDIRNNPFNGIVSLASLTGLKSIALTIQDPMQFDELFSLLNNSNAFEELRIENAPIVMLNELPMWNLENLTVLELSSGQLQSISGIEQMQWLEELNLNGNNLSQIGEINGLNRLQSLSALDNPLESLLGLENIFSLKTLRLDGNNTLSHLEIAPILTQLNSLQQLELHNVFIPSLWDLQIPFTEQLAELKLKNNNLVDISGLDQHQNLQSLSIIQNDLQDIFSLTFLTNLKSLTITENVSTLAGSSLTEFPLLNTLDLSGSQFTDPEFILSSLNTLQNLQHIALSGWELMDLDFLSPQIKGQILSLNLSNTTLNEAAMQSMFWFEQLTDLDLSNNMFTTVDFINELGQLQSLNLAGNALITAAPLTFLPSPLLYLNLLDNNQLPCIELDQIELNNPHLDFVRPTQCINGTPPDLVILSPFSGEQFQTSDLIMFNANANDFEDGALHSNIVWESSIVGFIGTGAFVDVSLPAGAHVITASVQDFDGNRVQQQISINVMGDAAEYCSATGNSTSYEWIESVELNGQTHFTGANGGYLDNSHIVLPLSPTINDLFMTAGYGFGAYVENWNVWIDWDQDGNFSPQELVASASGMFTVNANFGIPVTAPPGTTRMRVAMRWGSSASPCGSFSWGEVEDYTVNL